VLASLIAAFASGETMIALRRARSAAIAYSIAAILGLFGVVFLLVAAYIAAARRLGPVPAALWAAGIFIVLAILIVLFHRISSVGRAKIAARRRNSDISKIAIASGVALAPSLLRGGVGKMTLIVPAIAAVGYAIYKENSKPSRRYRQPPDDRVG